MDGRRDRYPMDGREGPVHHWTAGRAQYTTGQQKRPRAGLYTTPAPLQYARSGRGEPPTSPWVHLPATLLTDVLR